MRIRPAFVTASGTIVALAAIATVVLSTTPQEAGTSIIRLLWAAVFLAAWGVGATALLVVRQPMAIAIWSGLWPAIAATGLLMAHQQRLLNWQLLLGTLLATLCLSVYIWWRLRHRHSHD